MNRSRHMLVLCALAIAALGCHEPTVEEVRDEIEVQLNGLLRTTAAAVERRDNQQAVQGVVDRITDALDKSRVDLFADLEAVDKTDKLIEELKALWNVVFTEANVVEKGGDSRTFRVDGAALCGIEPGRALDPDSPPWFREDSCLRDLEKLDIRVEARMEGGGVDLALRMPGQRETPLLISVREGRLSLRVDLAAGLSAIKTLIKQIEGRDAVDPPKLSGVTTLSLFKRGDGVAVSLSVEQAVEVQLETGAQAQIYKLAASRPFEAWLGAGEAGVVLDVGAASFEVPLEEVFRTVTRPANKPLAGKLPAIRARVVARADGTTSLEQLQLGGLVELSLERLLFRGEMTDSLKGRIWGEAGTTFAALESKMAAKLTFKLAELRNHISDSISEAIADEVYQASTDKLTVSPANRNQSDAAFRVVAGSLRLEATNNPHVVTIEAGQCLKTVPTSSSSSGGTGFEELASVVCAP